ncbi:MAG: 2-oxoacid:acceptor oxidoreductase family protein [Coriobacteriales bacterium]|jgi:indolepyruvate ferredoxin oxidoreductase beta subunit|nr:2-oxoacid:acceptor oxidoreductase family protein [Coriobacteriales bacterium]
MQNHITNILITGVGGQGTVLASKLLAQTAAAGGMFVRQAETIGMAQRGGSVLSHVRICAHDPERQPASADTAAARLESPLIGAGSADIVVGFEPNETLRALPFFGPAATVVSATTEEIPPSASADVCDPLNALESLAGSAKIRQLVLVDNLAVYDRLGSAKPLNVALLGVLVGLGVLPFSEKDLIDVIKTMVKPRFVEMNLQALSYGASLAR